MACGPTTVIRSTRYLNVPRSVSSSITSSKRTRPKPRKNVSRCPASATFPAPHGAAVPGMCPTACRSVRVVNASRKQKILDRPYTYLILCAMLAERITSPSARPPELTPFPTHSSGLFVAAKNVNSFGINQIHTLSAKHPGWGSTGGHLGRIRCPRPTTHYPLVLAGACPDPVGVFMVLRIAFPVSLVLSQRSKLPGGCGGQAGWNQPLGRGFGWRGR